MPRLPHADELHRQALRHSIWLGILYAQSIGVQDVAEQLLTMLVYIDRLIADGTHASR